ncbi:hypothetical protein A2U01_0042371, partial [Trifolium medium]|nr:hypothetical protein [Trifolium medium]
MVVDIVSEGLLCAKGAVPGTMPFQFPEFITDTCAGHRALGAGHRRDA